MKNLIPILVSSSLVIWSGLIAFGMWSGVVLFQIFGWSIALFGALGIFLVYYGLRSDTLEAMSDKQVQQLWETINSPHRGLEMNFFRGASLLIILFCYLAGFYWLAGLWTALWVVGIVVTPMVEQYVIVEWACRETKRKWRSNL